MKSEIKIPDAEYQGRIKAASSKLAEADLDVLVANSNEADYANVRYFSAYWPLFESGAVAIAPSGEAALMIGPESEQYARGRSKLSNIHLMTEYRETADPAYPGVPVSRYTDVFNSIGVSKPKRIGIAGYLCTTMPMWEGLRACFPEAEIVNADPVMTALRQIKSEAEIACLREGLRIGEIALETALNQIKPGMTELQLVGVILEALYANGAESEAHPVYSFGGQRTCNAICRPTHRVFEKNDIVQLNLGARIDGYSPSVGRPICLGKMKPRQKELIEFGKQIHEETYELLKPGVLACDVAKRFEAIVHERGFGSSYLYGPCHGLGLIEVEKPWMETTSDYALQPNMTFQVDTFLADPDFGLRWENAARITDTGVERLNKGSHMKIIELG